MTRRERFGFCRFVNNYSINKQCVHVRPRDFSDWLTVETLKVLIDVE